MSTFTECRDVAKKMPSYSRGRSFEGIEYFSVYLPSPITYKAVTSQLVKATANDSNAEFEQLIKVLKKHVS